MKITIFLILMIGFLLFGCQLKKDQINTISITVFAPTLNNDSIIYITGSPDELGNWTPDKITLENQGNHIWKKSIEIDDSNSFEYKYTLGSWEYEGADNNGYPLSNLIFTPKTETTIYDTINRWTKASERQTHGQITGVVKYHTKIKGEGLLPRNIIVWLPPNYNSNSNIQYPVLYMLDGQNIIDPKTSAFGNDWQVDETCDSLIKNELLNPIIIVGIYNTANRNQEYLPGDTAQQFMKLVVDKIKPLIDENYRTLTDRNNTWIGGSSAGGTMAFMLCWEYPDIFSKGICMSPAFKIQEIDYVTTVLNYSSPKKPIKLYIDNGGIDLEEQLQPGIDEMLNALSEKGFKENKNYMWVKDTTASHTEKAWARRFPQAIQFIANN